MKKKIYPLYGFSERLRQSIWEKDIMDKEFAKRVGIGRTTLYTYLNGESSPHATVLARMCSILDVSADYLLFGRRERD